MYSREHAVGQLKLDVGMSLLISLCSHLNFEYLGRTSIPHLKFMICFVSYTISVLFFFPNNINIVFHYEVNMDPTLVIPHASFVSQHNFHVSPTVMFQNVNQKSKASQLLKWGTRMMSTKLESASTSNIYLWLHVNELLLFWPLFSEWLLGPKSVNVLKVCFVLLVLFSARGLVVVGRIGY